MKETHKDNMRVMSKVFRELNIPLFIIGGTALGYVREKDFIEGDKDVDFGMFGEDWYDGLLDKIKEVGFELQIAYGVPEACMQLTFRRGGYGVDIHPFYKFGKDRYHYSYVSGDYDWVYPDMIRFKYGNFGVEEKEFLGVKVLVPIDIINSYIIPHYGEDWHVVKEARKKWFYYLDPPNLEVMKMRMQSWSK